MADSTEAFRGGVAVITGAGSGIGEGLSRAAAALGMRVVLADIAADRVERVAAEIREQGGTAISVPTDVAEPAALDRLAATVHERLGAVRLLINNAGIETIGLAWELSAEAWERVVRINVLGVIHGVRAFAPRMLAASQPAFIANVASVGAFGMMPVQNPYVMSKHAVLSFTEGLRMEMELVGAPISVSVVTPGPVNTRIFRDAALGGESAAKHQAQMQAMVGAGISGDEAARRILAGIASREFWVSTHPSMTAGMAKARAEHLATLSTPAVTPALRALLQG